MAKEKINTSLEDIENLLKKLSYEAMSFTDLVNKKSADIGAKTISNLHNYIKNYSKL